MGVVDIDNLIDWDSNTCYAVVNEHIETWQTLLQDVSVDRGLSICSGGEVAYFAILPHVNEELVLVDNTYGSMYYAVGKYGLVDALGPEKAYEVMCSSPTSEALAHFQTANDGLPTWTACAKYKTHTYFPSVWRDISLDDVAYFHTHKEKCTFVHATLSTLADQGPFDLLYLSNALNYMADGGKTFHNDVLDKLVKPGGFVAYCYFQYEPPRVKDLEGSKLVPVEAKRAPNARKYGLEWVYEVAQIKH